MKPRLLVTGFGPFPGQSENPSEALVRALGRDVTLAREFNVRCAVLKTEYGAGLKKFKKELEDFKPDIVVCFGVAAGEKGFRLETVARNRSSTRHDDAAGKRPREAHIVKGGRRTLKATLPFRKTAVALRRKGIRARLSRNAGNYLCNYIFYHLMNDGRARGGFVHIPEPGRDTLTKAQLRRGAKIIIRNSA